MTVWPGGGLITHSTPMSAVDTWGGAMAAERFRCWYCKEPLTRGDRCTCGRGWFVEVDSPAPGVGTESGA